MPNRKKKEQQGNSALKDLVTVAFAEDMELARQYKQLLNENEIPAAIRSQSNQALSYQGVAVLVPEDFLDEAHVIIESQACMGDFYDMAFMDDEYDEPGEDAFNDVEY